MRNGFTLIELIVVLTIMSIFSGAGYVTYTKSIQSKELDRQVDAFVNVFSLARNKAISRDLSPNTSCSTFGGYKMSIWKGPPYQYRIVFVCTVPASEINQEPLYQFSKDITMSDLPNDPYSVVFNYPYGCIQANCSASNHIFTIKNTAISKCKTVTVKNLGNVLVQDITCP